MKNLVRWIAYSYEYQSICAMGLTYPVFEKKDTISSLVICVNDLFLLNLEERSDMVWIIIDLYASERLVSVFITSIYSAILRAFTGEMF